MSYQPGEPKEDKDLRQTDLLNALEDLRTQLKLTNERLEEAFRTGITIGDLDGDN